MQELIFEFGVINLGFLGSKFTWAKGGWGNSAIKRRLDSAIASMAWRLAYSKAVISHLGVIRFNHTPILLDSNSVTSFAHRPFRFEAVWTWDLGCHEVINHAWNGEAHGSDFIVLCKKQVATREALWKWNKVFGICQDKINNLLLKINLIREKKSMQENGSMEIKLQANLAKWLLRSEML